MTYEDESYYVFTNSGQLTLTKLAHLSTIILYIALSSVGIFDSELCKLILMDKITCQKQNSYNVWEIAISKIKSNKTIMIFDKITKNMQK